jgi:hypothetical protein
MQLIDDWRRVWRWGSVRVMAIPPFLVGLYAAQPSIFTGLISYVPEHWRPAALFVGTAFMSGLGIILRNLAPADKSNG